VTRTSGRKARANGESFEARLDWQHAQYRARGVAVLRQGPPSRPVRATMGGRSTILLLPLGDAPPDFLAIADGITYLFDAKSQEEGPWPLSKLEPHQARALDAATLAGCGHVVAGIVLSLEGGRRVFWCPWTALAPLWWAWHRRVGTAARGTASLSAEDCGRIGRECSGADWLAAARA